MKDHRLAVGRVFLLATLLALLPAPVASQRDSVLVRVVRVIDGDTIRVCCVFGDRVTVRYIGIDTPETHHLDKEGKYRANFGVTKDGSPQLVFYDKATKAIWSAPGQQVAGSSRLWILWARAFAGQYTATMALTTWPTKNQCEQDRTARLSKITREPGSGINFVCLPEGIDPRGTDRILLLDLFRFHP
jgi:hypothetical protein